jgi:hypothetical protein
VERPPSGTGNRYLGRRDFENPEPSQRPRVLGDTHVRFWRVCVGLGGFVDDVDYTGAM